MCIRAFLILLAVAGNAYAAGGSDVSHKTNSTEAKPMGWRLCLLDTVQDLFDKRAPDKAPGATMSFRLPKVDPAQREKQVVIVGADHRILLTTLPNIAFVFKRDTLSEDGDALVVVHRNFPKGEFSHSLVQVHF